MAKIKPNTETSNPADKASPKNPPIRIDSKGRMRCPNGYSIHQEGSANEYRCSGRAHRYRLNPDKIQMDKFGEYFLVPGSTKVVGTE